MSQTKYIHRREEWALSFGAKQTIQQLIEKFGFDRDLAIAVLECCVPVEIIYHLPEPEVIKLPETE